ncbi:LysR family transcriptional regulator [Microvirga sp. BT350]|uniref:LysR family transcriptional regulator n=1 Tax=Microvirga alba TaxID=2791025 RepID=A0A931FPS8_9HYPH|nr:LysR family transcriptional regulator [Microvirga alba]
MEVFIAIAEGGGFRAAAEKLGMAQPSVSSHVQALENQVGGALFRRRRGSGVDLTDLGKTFLTHARQLLVEADNMAVDLYRTRIEAERRIIFACQRSLSDFMPPLLAEFAGQHRDLELVTRVGRQEEVVDLIRSDKANLGLYLSNQNLPGLRSVVIGQQELVIVASPNHPLAHRKDIAPVELNNFSFVGPPEGSLFGQGMTQMLAEIGAENISIVSKATEFEFLRALVIAEVGLYCCLLKRVQVDLDRGDLVRLSIATPPLTMDVRQIFSVKTPVSPSVALFAEFLRRRHQSYSNTTGKALLTLAPTKN